MLVLYLYQAFVIGPATPPETKKPAAQTAAAPGQVNAPVETDTPTPATPAHTAVTAGDRERLIVVDTGKVEATITNRGGQVLHWRLKDHHDDKGGPVDLVPSNLAAEQGRPFSLKLPNADLSRLANNALYRVSGDADGKVNATTAAGAIVLEYEDSTGFAVRKEFRFEPNSYIVVATIGVKNGGTPVPATIEWGPGLGDMGARTAGGSFFTGNYVQPPSAIYNRDSKVTRIVSKEGEPRTEHEGKFLFAGVDDHYFLATAIDLGEARVEYRPVTFTDPDGSKRQLLAHSITPTGASRSVRFFVGPKQIETLQAAGINGELAKTINFGIFTILVMPLLQALKWLFGFIGNYGWSIIILTIIINLVMFPLRHKSLVSMRKMQAIQPQVKVIQERYADLKVTDPARQKMNTEIMNLYREKGVNPASGCVPMLLTMPVLFAFYSMLSQSIELRGADFTLWIHDLSLRDPYYVTPLLMGGTMIWQQWVTPTSADPMQQRMMMFMPLVLTAVFLSLPSGLAIYYLVSNLCQIGQQYITNRTIGPPPNAQPARSAADRRLKSAGGGKTPGAAGAK